MRWTSSASSRRARWRAIRFRAGEVGFVITGLKELKAAKVGDTITHVNPAAERGPAGLQGDQAVGLRGPLSDRGERVRRAARRAGEAQAQRRVAALRAGGVAGARLRLSLRLPRDAAHGHRAGAARARVRHGPHHHRADGGLRGGADRRHGERRSRIRRACPRRRASRRSASRSSRWWCSCRRSTSGRSSRYAPASAASSATSPTTAATCT